MSTDRLSLAEKSKLWVIKVHVHLLSPGPTLPNIFPIVHDRDIISNREQSETYRNYGLVWFNPL